MASLAARMVVVGIVAADRAAAGTRRASSATDTGMVADKVAGRVVSRAVGKVGGGPLDCSPLDCSPLDCSPQLLASVIG
jgi:hypothetical protein